MNNTAAIAAIAAVYRALAHYRRRQAYAPADHSAREIAQMQVLIEYLHDQSTPEQQARPQSVAVPAITRAVA